MIPAPRGYRAQYSHKEEGSIPAHHSYKDVIAFGDEGDALVLGDRGHLVPATFWTNFHQILEPGYDDQLWGSLEHLIPGGGWMERSSYENSAGTLVYEDNPVVAWAVAAGGTMEPVCTDSEGSVDRKISGSLVWHPDQSAPPPVPNGAVPADQG